jgi:hypothetical protein
MLRFLQIVSLFAVVFSGCTTPDEPASTSNPESRSTSQKPSVAAERHFQFNYAAKVNGVPAGAEVKIWVPIAENSPQQTVELSGKSIPAQLKINRDLVYGNQIGFFEIQQPNTDEPIEFSFEYQVGRKQAGLDDSEKSLEASQSKKFLNANRLVPKTGKPLELLAEKTMPKDAKAAGELLYEVVENHMKYDKSKPGYGNGDSVWACDSKTGNCTDFHSLFISLARSQNIPARFQIGFPLSPNKTEGKVGGYHCWAWFHIEGQGWLPVDISEADKHPELKSFYCGQLTKDRIAFSTGRDIKLIPESKADPLNYFVYPHVEVDGVAWPKDKIELMFSFKDVSRSEPPEETE